MLRVSAWLLLSTMGLIALIAFELNVPADHVPQAAPIAPKSAAGDGPFTLPKIALGPLARMNQTTTRPLFLHDRRPPVIAPPPVVMQIPEAAPIREDPIPQPVPQFRHLLSAVVMEGDDASAYLHKRGEVGLARLRKGETLEGWRLIEIRPDAVMLIHGEARTELELRPSEPSARAKVPAGVSRASRDQGENRGARTRGIQKVPDREPGIHSSQRPRRGPRHEALDRALRRADQRQATSD